MHTHNADITIEEMTKIEGGASCSIQIRDGQVTECHFAIDEMRRFFASAVRGKDVAAVSGQVSRVCGTCSNAHLLASLKAIEHGLGITPTSQTMILRKLLNYGLNIRDHALHLYVFSLPDLFSKNSILEFDENIPEEHTLLDDCFAVKNAGNILSQTTGGRSVHAPFPKIGGSVKIPTQNELLDLIPVLTDIRPKILHLIRVFSDCQFELTADIKFLALADPEYSFLNGILKTDYDGVINDSDFTDRLEKIQIPYSQASGFKLDGMIHMVGAIARMNINKAALHKNTQNDAAEYIAKFPSKNIFHNNLAQAIEILHCIDASVDLIRSYSDQPEPNVTSVHNEDTTGVGIIEAPRGTLCHRYEITAENKIRRANIIVPTGQNQIGIEKSIKEWVEKNLDKDEAEIRHFVEVIVRAYDPCMSCATHFLHFKFSKK
jgi:coenzyme F420-reducing hydrogenase alpha subunit